MEILASDESLRARAAAVAPAATPPMIRMSSISKPPGMRRFIVSRSIGWTTGEEVTREARRAITYLFQDGTTPLSRFYRSVRPTCSSSSAEDASDCARRANWRPMALASASMSPEFAPGFDELDVENAFSASGRSATSSTPASRLAATSDPSREPRRLRCLLPPRHLLQRGRHSPTSATSTPTAVAQEGDVQVAIATGGLAPSLSSWARRHAQEWLADGVAALVGLYGKLRAETRETMDPREREAFWKSLDPDALLRIARSEGIESLCEQSISLLASPASRRNPSRRDA